MNLNEWRTIFITIGLLFIIIFIMPSLSSYFWQEENNNIAMAILNNDMLIDDYYPDNNLTIETGDVLDWYIYIENNVDEIQYFAVKVKIVDGNVPPPNFTTCSYCQEPEIYEIRCLALNDQKIFKPFNFSILQANFGENFTIIEKILINGVYFETNIRILNDTFKILFELWIFDEDTSDFYFNFNTPEKKCIWNQIWVRLK